MEINLNSFVCYKEGGSINTLIYVSKSLVTLVQKDISRCREEIW